MMLIVNGVAQATEKTEVSYDDIIKMAWRTPEPGVVYTITYRHGKKRSAEGSLNPGEKVETRNGMIFNCVVTGEA